MSGSEAKFSVIVPTCNRPDLLVRCLRLLAPECQEFPSNRYEVIVTDDSKTPETRDVVAMFPGVTWTGGPRRGPAANRNHGVARARYEWLAFIDDDCLPAPTWLRALGSAARNTQAECLEGLTHADRARKSLAEVAPLNETGGYWWTCNLAVRTDAFRALAGFDESFPYACMEDVDFRIRAKKVGYSALFVPGATVCHPYRLESFPHRMTSYLASLDVFLAKHPDQLGMLLHSTLQGIPRAVLKDTVVNGARFNFAGLRTALRRHHMEIVVARRLLLALAKQQLRAVP